MKSIESPAWKSSTADWIYLATFDSQKVNWISFFAAKVPR